LGDKKELKKKTKIDYRVNFLTTASAASSQKAYDELNDDNETNNFIIEQYRQRGVTVAEAVEAYNHDWIYG